MRPKKIAIPQQIIPAIEPPFLDSLVVARAIMLIINPIPENGILIQLSDPKQGRNAVSIPRIERIPHTKLSTCISCLLVDKKWNSQAIYYST